MQTVPVVSTGQPVILQNQTVIQRPQRVVSVKETSVLGILQIIIGGLSIILGIPAIVLLDYYAAYVSYPIWTGLWICITGILGVCSSRSPANRCLNGTNLGFCIVSCFLAFVDFITYAVAVAYFRDGEYKYCNPYYPYNCWWVKRKNHQAGTGIYAVLLVAMIAEFVIALTASIYCCKSGCGCCDTGTQGVVIQPGVAQPVVSHVSYVQTTGMVAGQAPMVYSTAPPSYPVQGYVQHQPHYTSLGAHQGGPAHTQVAYSNPGMAKPGEAGYQVPAIAAQPPPAYS